MQLMWCNPAESGKEINLSRCSPGELFLGDITASDLGASVAVEGQGGENLTEKACLFRKKVCPEKESSSALRFSRHEACPFFN